MVVWASSIFDDVGRDKLGVGGGGNSVEAEEQGPQLGWGVLLIGVNQVVCWSGLTGE
jgi:hypothetical protein